MLEAIIFDFYGVLYSNFDWSVIDERIYCDPDRSIQFREAMHRANLGEITNAEFLEFTSKLAQDAEHLTKRAVNPESSVNYPALGLIETLKPRYRIGLLSNGSSAHIMETLKSVGGAEKYFDSVVTSSDSKHIKPAAVAFFDMAQRLGSRPQTTLVIDDSPGHIAGAIAAGFLTIRFTDMENLRQQIAEVGVECA